MKAYTGIEQSKKLAEILPIESADMWYCPYPNDVDWYDEPRIGKAELLLNQLPCWSLVALQDIIKINYKLEKTFFDQSDYCTYSLYDSDEPTFRTFEYDNPVDACYEMIIKLHEQKLL